MRPDAAARAQLALLLEATLVGRPPTTEGNGVVLSIGAWPPGEE
jgi:hypothetical protein